MKKHIRRGLEGLRSTFAFAASRKAFGPAGGARSAGALRTAAAAAVEPLESRLFLSASPVGRVTHNDLEGNPPQATISAPDVTTAGQATETVTIVYTSDASISLSTVAAGNITVTEENTTGPAPLSVSLQQVSPGSGSPTTVTATYAVAAPNGTFGSGDDGTYDVTLQDNQVEDGTQQFAPAQTATFRVDVPALPPAAVITAPPDVTTAGAAPLTVSVAYTDAVAVRANTIAPNNVTVTGPNNTTLAITGVSLSPSSGNAAAITATYTIAPPAGGFTAAADGVYTVALDNSHQVLNTAALPATAAAATFSVAIPTPVATPPMVSSVTAPAVTTAGQTTETVTVVYADAAGLNPATITPGNLVVTGPGAASGVPLTVTGVTLNTTAAAPTQVTATYTLTAPAGGFTAADNGTYTVALQANQVEDAGSLFAPATSTTFQVNVAAPAAPTALISPPPDVTVAGVTSVAVVVTYTGATAIDAATIDAADLSVTGPGGTPLTVTGVTTSPAGNAASITATYTVAAPGGAFANGDNGTYTIALNSGQVLDVNGLAATATPATFDVNVPAPKPTVDPTFNGGGPVSTGFVGESLVTTSTGAILVAGHQGDASTNAEQAVLERLLPSGAVDRTFGSNGQMVIGSSGGNSAAYSIGLDASGRILVAGTHAGQFAVWRLTANGKLDNRFGTAGLAATPVGSAGDDVAYSFAIDGSGSIVLGGSSGGAFAFARFTANGTLDTTFGSGGRALFNSSNGSDIVGSVAVGPGGNLVAVGASDGHVAVLSLTRAGAQDPAFDGGNTLIVNGLGSNASLGTPDYTEGLSVQPDGQILVDNTTTDGHFGVARINADGTLDATFGTGGLATANFGGNDDADAVQVQGSGQIFALGTTDAGGTPQTAVAAFTPAGQLDPSFGVGGKFTIPAGIASPAGTLAPQALHLGDLFLRAFGTIQANGQLVVGTSNEAASPTTTSTPLRRLNVPGSGTVGTFGAIAGKSRKLVFLEANGVRVTVSMKGGGMGTVFYNGSQIDLVLTGARAGSAVTVTSAGGNRRVALRNVTSDSGLANFTAKTADFAGTFSVPGRLAAVTLGTIAGGTLAAAGGIGSLTVAGAASNAVVLAGASLGSDGAIGGTGGAADTFAAGSIAKISITGAVTASTFGAGLKPTGGSFRGGRYVVVGGAASSIGTVSVKGGVDANSRFYAGAFRKIKAPKAIKAGTDARFQVLPD